MDGFMHQPKPVGVAVDEYGLPGGMSQPLLNTTIGEDKLSKFSNLYKYCTLLSIMCLMATITFFAVHVGPFVEQPRGKLYAGGAGTSQGGSGGETTSEFGALAAGPLLGEDSSGAVFVNDTVNEAGEVIGIPYWMSRTFMNWRRNYLGAASELPFIWTHEKTGGDVVAETMSKCLSKVVAGDGKKYDISGAYTESFNQPVSGLCFE
jgi:hypothetical protein